MTTRRLAAILAADVVGFSAMMERDEEGTFNRLKALRLEVIEPILSAHAGRLVKTTGDGFLAEFASPVFAVRAALAIHDQLAEHQGGHELPLRLRAGVNMGDVIVEDDGDIYGDGVNIAARLEQIAEPGAVCISQEVYGHIAGKIDRHFENRGEQQVKNIARAVQVYSLTCVSRATASPKPLTLPDKPSIAVLPFANLSGDTEQDYFADGVVEDIITALSRFAWLFVIARNSSFAYKGRAIDVRRVGRDLGVRYILEGSIRRGGRRLRISGQLIDASTGAHLWADRFEGPVEDVFELQDAVAVAVVSAVAPKLEQAEIERAWRTPTEHLGAYDYFLRARAALQSGTKAANDEALKFLGEAMRLDPGFASAWGLAARCYTLRHANAWMSGPHEVAQTEVLARRTTELGRSDAVALCLAGFALARVLHEMELGASWIERALVLNPNLAAGWQYSGILQAYLGEHARAVDELGRAARLSPLDPELYSIRAGTSLAQFVAGRYQEAASSAEMAILERPNFFPALRNAAASYALAGRLEPARLALSRVMQADAALRVSNVRERVPLRRADDLARYETGLRLTGLPE